MHPQLSITPKTTFIPLTTSLPYAEQNPTHPLKMTTQSIKITDSQVIVDFKTNADESLSVMKLDAANNMFLIQGNEPPDGREIKPAVEVIDSKQKQFRAIFTLTSSQMAAIDDFYLQTGYSNTVTNTPIDLKPIPFIVD